jgi:hypothetical protein
MDPRKSGRAGTTFKSERAMNIDVSKDELGLLRDLLEQKWADLRVEIRRTETERYREELRQLENLATALLHKLERIEPGDRPPTRSSASG